MLTQTIILVFAFALRASCSIIEWAPCNDDEFNTTLPVQCGSLPVPLDYTQASGETITLEVIRIPASIQPSKGSILFNFGGPGLPARDDLVTLGPVLQQLSGGAYNLIAFDPRGTGKTIPFTCTEDAFLAGQILAEARAGNDSDTALRRLWTRGKVDANICKYGNGNSTAEYIGTAFVARDLISVVDALGEDGMLRYWGFSYGTTLGATVAAMFPQRIDKMILDGVQNPHEYYHSNGDFEEWTDSDAVLSYFFASCIESGPENCALAATSRTAQEMEQDIWRFFDDLRAAPIAVGTTVLDLLSMKGFLLEQLKVTYGWPDLAEMLDVIVYGSEATKNALFDALVGSLSGGTTAYTTTFPVLQSQWGIHCGDRIPRLDSFEDAQPTFNQLFNTSRLVGDLVSWTTAHCAQWPWHAKETYMGDFHVKTKNPILVASNTRDAHTPLRSARNISSTFEGSGLLEVNGTGHATLNAPSICSFKAILSYWTNGSLPSPDLVCETPQPFSKYTWAEVFESLAVPSETQATLHERQASYSRWLR